MAEPKYFKYVDTEIPASEAEKAMPIAIAGLPAGGGGGGGDVASVNGQTGEVVLDAESVGALPEVGGFDAQIDPYNPALGETGTQILMGNLAEGYDVPGVISLGASGGDVMTGPFKSYGASISEMSGGVTLQAVNAPNGAGGNKQSVALRVDFGGIYAYDYSGDGREPYIGENPEVIVTNARLEQALNAFLGFGQPGQVLAMNSTGDGYEWVDPS